MVYTKQKSIFGEGKRKMFESITEKFEEYSDMLFDANDFFASIPDKLRPIFGGLMEQVHKRV